MEQKSVWSQLIETLKSYVPGAIKKYAPILALYVVKQSSKAYGSVVWVIAYAFNYLWKKAEPWIESLEYRIDMKKLDQASLEAYEKLKEGGASAEDLKKKRLDLLNGNSSKL